MAYLLLAAAQAVGLLLIPFSGFGVWLQLLALTVFAWQTEFFPVGIIPLAILVGLGVVAESVRLATGTASIPTTVRKRLGISGLVGGLAGAAAGVVLPLVGSMFGVLIGSAVGTLIAAFTLRSASETRSQLAASALAMALSTATGTAVAVFSLLIILQ